MGRNDRILLAVIVVLIIIAVYPLVFPFDVTPSIYMPFVSRSHRVVPDERFGVVEIAVGDAALLGLARSDYVSGQWRLPLPGDTAVFLRPTERPHSPSWLLCSWSARDGWYDKDGCRQWVREHPGFTYIVGNELALGGDIGDGDLVTTSQYAQWYYEAWGLIKGEDSTAIVAPYGPIGQDTAGLLIAVWDSYREQFGSLLRADFYPVHHYCGPSDEVWWCWTRLTHWIDWLEQHRGSHWDGPQDYWLTEWGLPAWSQPIPIDVSLALMEGMTPLLQTNTIGISNHAWWPSCNAEWFDQSTLLIRGGQVTELGEKYLELANR